MVQAVVESLKMRPNLVIIVSTVSMVATIFMSVVLAAPRIQSGSNYLQDTIVKTNQSTLHCIEELGALMCVMSIICGTAPTNSDR